MCNFAFARFNHQRIGPPIAREMPAECGRWCQYNDNGWETKCTWKLKQQRVASCQMSLPDHYSWPKLKIAFCELECPSVSDALAQVFEVALRLLAGHESRFEPQRCSLQKKHSATPTSPFVSSPVPRLVSKMNFRKSRQARKRCLLPLGNMYLPSAPLRFLLLLLLLLLFRSAWVSTR